MVNFVWNTNSNTLEPDKPLHDRAHRQCYRPTVFVRQLRLTALPSPRKKFRGIFFFFFAFYWNCASSKLRNLIFREFGNAPFQAPVSFMYALLLSGQTGKPGKLQQAMLVHRAELFSNEFSLPFSVFKTSISIIRRDGIIRNGMTYFCQLRSFFHGTSTWQLTHTRVKQHYKFQTNNARLQTLQFTIPKPIV